MSFEFYLRIKRLFSRCVFKLLYARAFEFYGQKVSILGPDIIEGSKYISLYDNVSVGCKCWLLALKINDINPILKIGPGTCIGRFSHIVSVKSVTIGKDVLIADKVYISDNVHDFSNVYMTIIKQPVIFKGEVIIGDGSWIGENVSIIGAKIGCQSIIGANSVVTSDIPDYAIAVGSPARVIKLYNFSTNVWESI